MNVTPNVKLIFDADNNNTYVEDNTVWPSVNIGGTPTPLNVALSLKGLGTLFNPSGGAVFSVLNPSSPLINLSGGATQSATYALPVALGEIVNGRYNFSYSARGSRMQAPVAIEGSGTGYVLLNDNNLSAQLLQAGDIVTISGSTSPYNGAWDVVGTEYETGGSESKLFLSRNGVPIGGPDSGSVAYSITRDFTTTYTPIYTGCTKVKPAINFNAQPYNGEFGQAFVTDATDYTGVTLEDGLVSVKYPDGLVPAPTTNPVEGTSVTLVALATGTYTITLTGDVFKTQTDGLTIQYTLSGIRIKGNPANVFERVVVWRGDLCCLSSCIEEVITANYNYLKQGKESPLTSTVASVAIALGNYQVAVSCGDQAGIDSAYKEIENALALSGCKCDCNCGCSDGPIWITNSSQEGESIITQLQDEINSLQDEINNLNLDFVESVTGLNIDNTDPQNPIVRIAVDGTTITGDGTPLNPLKSEDQTLVYDSILSQLTLTKNDGSSDILPISSIARSNSRVFYVGASTVEISSQFPSESFKFVVKSTANSQLPFLITNPDYEELAKMYSSGDLKIGKYPETRDNGVGLNYLYTDANGNLKSGNFQTAVEDNVNKICAGYLIPNGTAAPIMTIPKNNIGGVTWSRVSTGVYMGTFSYTFDPTKTVVLATPIINANESTPMICQAIVSGASTITIKCLTYNSGTWSVADGQQNSLYFNIQVYP